MHVHLKTGVNGGLRVCCLFYLLYQLGTGRRTLEAKPVRGVYHEPGNLSKNH